MNLIWVQLEAYGALNKEKSEILSKALDQCNFDSVKLTNTVCAAPSTVMSTMGLLTGVSPALLAKDHIPKRKQVPGNWQAQGLTTLTDFLEKQNYNVTGINAVYDSPRCLPMFKDTHAGVTPDMNKKEGKNFWDSWCIPQRLRNIIPTLKKNKKAFFFHLIDADILPEIINDLEKIGLNKDNTVLVLAGDHGWPVKFIEQEPALFHDLHQEENNIRIACHLAYPGCKAGKFNEFTSALDLAPTILDIMGYDWQKVLPKANGFSLLPYIKNSYPLPDRIIRIDNRYIAQRRNKVITLVSSNLRYTFRYESNWSQQAFYKYQTIPVAEKEELYLRDDIEEINNLINDSSFKDPLEAFRLFFRKSESQIINYFYENDLFEHYLFKEQISDLKNDNGRKHSSQRILKAILKLLNSDSCGKIAIYGAGNHTRTLLNLKLINDKITVILDDSPLVSELAGIPVENSKNFQQFEFDSLLLSSDYFEEQLYLQALKWLPNDKKIIKLYGEFGPSMADRIISRVENSGYIEIVKEICRVIDINKTLVLSDSSYQLADIVLNSDSSICTIIHSKDNIENLYEKIPYYKDGSSKFTKQASYTGFPDKIRESKFDLILHQCKSTYEAIEYFCRAEEILDTCGLYLLEMPNNKSSESILIDLKENDNLKISVDVSTERIIILAYLWRFNS